jgi:circadian clock protein KaiC
VDKLFTDKTRNAARVKTGIPALDEMLHGGFMQGDSVMLAGSAGSGKTTLALQYLVNGVIHDNDRAVYLTFEQLPDQIYRDAQGFGWDIRRLEEQGKMQIVCTSPDLMLDGASGDGLLHDTIKEFQPQRIVIDSLSHFGMYIPESNLRREVYRMIMAFKTKGISSLLLYEAPQMMGNFLSVGDSGLSFLVDAIVLMKPVEINSSIRRLLGIIKMRGSDHDKLLREFEITSHGIEVQNPFTNYEGILTGSPHRSQIETAANSWSTAFEGAKQKHSK